MFQKEPDACRDYTGKLVRLYAEFGRDKLLAFLREAEYDLQEALQECTARELVDEQVFLLGRMGRTRMALEVLLSQPNRDLSYYFFYCCFLHFSGPWIVIHSRCHLYIIYIHF